MHTDQSGFSVRFIFIRHGEAQWNADGKYLGITDLPLNEKGMEQARALGKRFEGIHVDAVYSSPLQRAYDTAMAVAGPKGLEVQTLPGMREIDYGDWEGHTISENRALYGDPFEDYRRDPFTYPLSGEGSQGRALLRVGQCMEDLKAQYRGSGKTLAVVSHGGILKLALFWLLGISPRLYRCIELENTSLTIVDVNEDRTILRRLNDAHHLHPDGL